MTTAYAYARYSSDNQRDESIESQLQYVDSYAKQNDIEILKTYADYAVSGTHTEGREQFNQMLSDIKNKKEVTALLVWDLTRFARNAEDAFRIENQLLRHGVEIIAVTQPMRTRREDGKINTSVLTYRRMIHVMSEASSYQNSEMTSAHMYSQSQRSNENGRHPHLAGQAPYGYKLSERRHYKDHRYLEINEAEAPAVRLAWQWVDEGLGYREIASRLTEMGYRTRRGTPFSFTTIHEITHHAIYAGIYSYGEIRYNRLTTGIAEKNPDAVVVPGGVPAIIDMALYERVSTMLDTRKTGTRAKSGNLYILSGLVFCKYCGARMVGDSGAKTRATRYRCSGTSCQNKRWCTSRPMLEHQVMGLLVDMFLKNVDIKKISSAIEEWENSEGKDLLTRIREVETNLKRQETKISALMDLLVDAEVRDLTKKKILETQRQYNENKELLKRLMASSQARSIQSDATHVEHVIRAGLKAFNDWDEVKLKQIANIFIDRIEIAHFGETKIFWATNTITEIPPSPPDPSNPSRRAREGVGCCTDTLGTAKNNPVIRDSITSLIQAVLERSSG